MNNKFVTVFLLSSVFAISVLATDLIHSNIFADMYEDIVTTSISDSQSFKYNVSVFKGKLAVFEGNSKIPYKVYNTFINTLPEEDIRLLTDGIRVKTSSELNRIIEEYTS